MQHLLQVLIPIILGAGMLHADDGRKSSFARAFIRQDNLIMHIPSKHPQYRVYSTNLNDYRVVHVIWMASLNCSVGYSAADVRRAIAEADRAVGREKVGREKVSGTFYSKGS